MEYIEFDVDAVVRREEQRLQGILDRPQNGDRVAGVRLGMGESMNRNLAVYRHEEGMRETMHDLQGLKERYTTVPVDNKGRHLQHGPGLCLGAWVHARLRRDHRRQRPGT